MIDKMMITYLQKLEQQFVTQGGIRERMHKARTNYRKGQDEELAQLRVKVTEQKKEIERLKQLLNEKGIKY
jgi:four helix bundle suffix protein